MGTFRDDPGRKKSGKETNFTFPHTRRRRIERILLFSFGAFFPPSFCPQRKKELMPFLLPPPSLFCHLKLPFVRWIRQNAIRGGGGERRGGGGGGGGGTRWCGVKGESEGGLNADTESEGGEEEEEEVRILSFSWQTEKKEQPNVTDLLSSTSTICQKIRVEKEDFFIREVVLSLPTPRSLPSRKGGGGGGGGGGGEGGRGGDLERLSRIGRSCSSSGST